MLRGLLTAVLVLAGGLQMAHALESAPVVTDHVTATLISDSDAVEAGKPVRVGLRLRIIPGWHTYWSNPGDAGVAPDLDLTLPPGTHADPIAWPAPSRLPEGPVMTYGYTGEVVLPVTITPGPGDVAVTAQASWLVCERICVPEEGTFSLNLPSGHVAPSAQSPLFATADQRRPVPTPFEARIAPDGTLSLTGQGLSLATVKDAWFFPAGWGAIDQAAPQMLTVVDGQIRLKLTPGQQFDAKAGLGGVAVLKDGSGQESFLTVAALPGAPAMPAPSEASLSVAELLGFAFLGGLILNLMPCVFPILAMKACALSRLCGEARGAVRAHAISYTIGVVVAFGLLGAALLTLRAAGSAAGWGFQFQSPIFVAAMAWLLFGVGLNLSGVFEIGSSLAGTGHELTTRGGHAGSFFTGFLAVVVATPCTAPFMGAAIAGALSAPVLVSGAVFVAMGLGLAAPYALLAIFPAISVVFPKPGNWMDVLKQALAFPMYGAAVFLLWVVVQQMGADGILVGAGGFVLLGLAGWAFGLAQRSSGIGRRISQGVAATAFLAILGVLGDLVIAGTGTATAAAPAGETFANQEPFSPARLAALRAEGRPVFVNMTAAWCVTCLVNERVALSPPEVRDQFASHHVAYLKGDWTRQDPVITEFLRAQNRDGVPLYVFYPPGNAAPTILPQILTAGALLDQINHAGS